MPSEKTATRKAPYVPQISSEELAEKKRRAIALLDQWETEDDGEEQRETMKVLRNALGKNRVASNRNLFP